jgi:hypothetical protein
MLYVCPSEFLRFLQMGRCVLFAELFGICDVFLRMNMAKSAMCGFKDTASLSKFFHLTEYYYFLAG